MYRVGVLTLQGYRAWTDSIGNDREWIIQMLQSGIYGLVAAEAASIGGHVIPLRYDYMLILDPGFDQEGLRKIALSASSMSPTRVLMSAACSHTLLEAQARASADPGVYDSCIPDPLAVVHLDVNDISSRTPQESAYATFEYMMRMFCDVMNAAKSLGGLAQYLGGDNIAVFLPKGSLSKFMKYARELQGVKAGVGVHRSPREAMALAARALRSLRALRALSAQVRRSAWPAGERTGSRWRSSARTMNPLRTYTLRSTIGA
jgi:GTP cyclohydrolase IIa